MNEITGKVAKIINARTLALNIGAKHGVTHGMVFQIFSSETKVKDPDSGKELGSIKLPKVRVRVVTVDNSFCVAETFEYKTVNKGGQGGGTLGVSNALRYFEPPRLVKEYITFEISDDQQKELEEEKSIVKIGDVAELLEYDAPSEVEL